MFKEIQMTSKIMTFDRKVTKEWFHNNKKQETRRLKAFFNFGANIGKFLTKTAAANEFNGSIEQMKLDDSKKEQSEQQNGASSPVELSPLDLYQRTLKEIRFKYASQNIFVHPCSYC